MTYIDHGEIMAGIACREIDVSRVAYDETPTIVIFSEKVAFRGLARDFASMGYSVRRYVTAQRPSPPEQIGRLATYLATEARPDAAVIHVSPAHQELFLHALRDIPLVMLDDGSEHPVASELTCFHRAHIGSSWELLPVVHLLLDRATNLHRLTEEI